MRDMLKRIVVVIFILLVVSAISGFLYTQRHPLEKTPVVKYMEYSKKTEK